ncbi:MAG TPA: diguanylate cyclase [Solirubrobacteraceae bacterium]|nr:diguanylate cyclase [Solirubrobacteraceae bacterium]
MPAAPEQPSTSADDVLAHAQYAAVAAMRELPEALIFVFDRDLRFVVTAGQAFERLGKPSSYGEGRPVSGAFPAEVWREVEPLFNSALDGETRSREVWTESQRHCLMVDVGPLRMNGPDGRRAEQTVAGGVAVVLDITARRQADMLAAGAPGAGFEEVFERAPIGTGLLDREGRWLLVNRALCEITGYTAEELIGNRFDGIVHPDDAFNDRDARRQLDAGEIPAFQIEKRYFDAAGETVSAIVSMSLVRDEQGAPLHYIAQLQDVSDRRELERQTRHLADHDELTGLRNRRLFEHDLKLQVARSRRYGEAAGLLVLDLDNFTHLVQLHGAPTGEETLVAVSRALTRRLRETDLIASIGDDEFAVLLPHIDEEGITVVAEGLARVIPACTIDVGDAVLHPSASIGYTLIDDQTVSAEQALLDAQRAMRAARRSAPGQPS